MSTAETMCSRSQPAFTTPGQRTIQGVRVLWCQTAVFAKGSGMPWSDRNITTVSSACPLSASASRMAATQSSARRTEE